MTEEVRKKLSVVKFKQFLKIGMILFVGFSILIILCGLIGASWKLHDVTFFNISFSLFMVLLGYITIRMITLPDIMICLEKYRSASNYQSSYDNLIEAMKEASFENQVEVEVLVNQNGYLKIGLEKLLRVCDVERTCLESFDILILNDRRYVYDILLNRWFVFF
jgi:hypothetical protein